MTAGPRRWPAPELDWLEAEVTRRLFGRRQLLLQGPLDGERATRLAAELLTLEAEGVGPINLSVNSTGGDLPSLFTAVDVLAAMQAPVHTRCLGQASGTAVALVASGTGHRRATPHARFVLRLPETEVTGTAHDLVQAAEADTAAVERLLDLLRHVTGRSRDQIAREWLHGRVLSAAEALAEGLVDDVG